MKYFFLVILFTISTTIFSADLYDSKTGKLHIPSVVIGTDNFEVEMISQGDLIFKVISVSSNPVEFYELIAGSNGGGFDSGQYKVIKTQLEFNKELLNYSIFSPPKNIDFTQGQVLLVDMGLQNTGGYSIKVESIDVRETNVIANLSLEKPGDNCLTTQAMTNPYQFVYISTLKEILLHKNITINDCN